MHPNFTNYPTSIRASAVGLGGADEADDDHLDYPTTSPVLFLVR